MEFDNLSTISQIATGLATLAVAVFLASQLRLQHKDSIISMRAGVTNTLTALAEHHISDPTFTNIFLRGIRDEPLDEEERHRYNMFLNMYFIQCQQMWFYKAVWGATGTSRYLWRQGIPGTWFSM